ncbi:MAG: hypothetical protein GY862_05070 [Gammaproteobacteria bacterium]|nr:hypothetical protein [Gammaproteobacteria bacterium]
MKRAFNVGLVTHAKDDLLEFLPSHKEAQQAKLDTLIADDIQNVGSQEMQATQARLTWVEGERARNLVKDMQTAYTQVRQEKEEESTPFGTAESDTAMTRYLMVQQSLGVLADRSKAEILAEAQAAIATSDTGQMAYWVANGKKLLGSLKSVNHDEFEQRKSILAGLEAAAVKKMSGVQEIRHNELKKLESAWKSEGMESILGTVEAAFDGAGKLIVAGMVTPRGRTAQEVKLADARQNIRQVKAEREAAAEERAAFDALG